MKNGIIIKGVAYEARKRLIGIAMPFDSPCKLCDYKRRCDIWMNPCALFEDKNHEVYFKKAKEE